MGKIGTLTQFVALGKAKAAEVEPEYADYVEKSPTAVHEACAAWLEDAAATRAAAPASLALPAPVLEAEPADPIPF